MLFLDNLTNTVRDDLRKTIRKGSRVSIAAACFSVYAYQELKEQLEGVEELRFLFTSPTFLKEKVPKAKREFYIPRLNRERSIWWRSKIAPATANLAPGRTVTELEVFEL